MIPEANPDGSYRHFMRLSYNGAPYHGWQRQPADNSVQQTIEEALATVMRREVPVTGAGRTDTGVNASCMWAHLDLPEPVGDRAPGLLRAFNAILGPDIAVYEIITVHPGAHARFDATSRTYHYHVHTAKNPFVYAHSLQLPPTIDFDAMNRAARQLLDTDDFTSFAKLHTDARTNICRVTRAEWVRNPLEPDRWTFVITADRFLRNMVRAVTGTLLQVGRGRLTDAGLAAIIAARDRCAAGTSMPPHPLFLHDITYPYPLGS